MQLLFAEIQLGLLGRKLALPAGGQSIHASHETKQNNTNQPKKNPKQNKQTKPHKKQSVIAQSNTGECLVGPSLAHTLRVHTIRRTPEEGPHPGPCGRGTVAMVPGRQAGLPRRGQSSQYREAAQRCRYEPGHHRSSLGDGKEARGEGRKSARWHPALAGRLLPHKSQLRASAATVPAPQQPLAPACARGGHYFQEAPGTAPLPHALRV